MNTTKISSLNPVTKIIIVLLAMLLFYLTIFSFLKPFFLTQPLPMMQMMGQMYGSDILNFSSGSASTMNLIALLIALGIGGILSYYLFQQKPEYSIDREYHIIKKALSGDEQALLDEVKKAGEITQDSLRFRLNWSKAKVSTILTHLDKMNLIQRERQGKTYVIRFTNRKEERF